MNGLNTAFQKDQNPHRDRMNETSHDVFTSYRVIVPHLNSTWAKTINDRLTELTSLPVGWDGYAGQPVSFPCAYFVANMLERLCQENVPAPSLVPGSDGSIQVEWHRNMFDVELDVLDAQNIIATRVNRLNGSEEVVEIQNDFSEIVDWISAISDDVENSEH